MLSLQKNSVHIKQIARQYGFDYCGIARAEKLEEDARRLEQWLSQGMNGKMAYMENHFDLRIDPQKLLPGAKSVITFLIYYYPGSTQDKDIPNIAKYAWGKDYHEVIRKKLQLMMEELKLTLGDFTGRGFVDSAPVLERTWAKKSGLGWVGKNGNLIHKQQGSFFFIATLIVDIALAYDDPYVKDYCGTCTKCIDSCPTEAIEPNKVINGSKCISYYTIELKDAIISDEMKGKFNNWIFGCDVCQDVCPWNRFSKPHREESFTPIPEILHMKKEEWMQLTQEKFSTIFKESPLKRTKFKGIQRNLRFILAE